MIGALYGAFLLSLIAVLTRWSGNQPVPEKEGQRQRTLDEF